MLSGVDHLRHTHNPAVNAYSHGQPEHGANSPMIRTSRSIT